MQTTEQSDLTQRLLDDDEHVLDDILRAFGPMILAVLGKRFDGILREQDLEDVLSIGLFRMWTSRRRYDGQKASLKVWLFRIVENAAKDVLRHGWHKARQLEIHSTAALTGTIDRTQSGNPTENGFQSTTEESAAQTPSQLQMDLREIISELPAEQRTIIAADSSTKDGVASSEWLAETLSLSKSSVRVYRKRAMDRIRKELAKRGYDVPENSK